MEFSIQALRAGLEPLQDLSGLRFSYTLGRTPIVFAGAGTLILALRHPVRIKLGEQERVIPKFGAYFLPPEERNRHAPLSAEQQSFEHHIVESQTPVFIQAQSDGPWLMISASEVTWRVLSGELKRMGAAFAQPLAGLWPSAGTLARWTLKKIRRTRHMLNQGVSNNAEIMCSTLEPIALFEMAQAMQATLATFGPWVERCPGRWTNQKLQVFRRLMRVRQFIDLRCTDSLPIEKLASMANYSRSHFLTVFREVFGETPHNQLLEQRLNFAKRMLGQHGYSVQETTLAAGFEDRSSFSKLFRRRFGVTALATRQAAVCGKAGSANWGRIVLI